MNTSNIQMIDHHSDTNMSGFINIEVGFGINLPQAGNPFTVMYFVGQWGKDEEDWI